MKSRFARIAVIGLMLTLGAVPLQLLTTSTAFAQASGTTAMTNADVVKLAKLGFSSEVIKEKIDGASAVNFKLEVDDLVNLKSSGVSQDVISEMLKRADGGAASAAAGSGTPPTGAMAGNPFDVTMVTTNGGNVHLRGISGTISTTNAFVTVLEHYNFPGVAATVRTHDARPSFIVNSTDQPKGRIYIVSVEVDKGDQDRSLKLGNSRFWGGMKNVGAPDKDNQIAYDAVAVGNGNQWKLTPTTDLKPGEYGLYMGELFDFGVDE
ncbi:hypothetical protein [Dyella caseinilytica]|uniref:Uncharacterized protein n=1 Tax=Dyella caseinilytica TaxID=1849581 RepID=A0ABX7GZP6_9GAMM|nr:hypothetical protein [Dyella caseinilytica]QRN55122.1 hypothetical protein ISN74_07240 [Dyella caseinilytica]GFZ99517.1 hypothetical protein GCM10011408_20290 [Dyella caseinilytica]